MKSKRFRKSSGVGAVLARSRGGGAVVAAALDRRPARVPAPRQGILYVEAREVLNGECVRRIGGFETETEATEPRVLLVPYGITTCPATALLLCRRNGLLKAKLANLPQETADYLYLTTLARAEPEN